MDYSSKQATSKPIIIHLMLLNVLRTYFKTLKLKHIQ